MSLSFEQLSELHAPFFRVGVKAIIFDSKNRLVLVQHVDGKVELPGGGLEEDESFEDCLHREVMEETGVAAELASGVLHVQTSKSDRHGWAVCRLIVLAKLTSEEFHPGDDMQAVLTVTRDELDTVKFTQKDRELIPFIRTHWQER